MLINTGFELDYKKNWGQTPIFVRLDEEDCRKIYEMMV